MTLQAARRHPCFDADARSRLARVHLPVAPACNVSCNFCDRKHDCLNESRPGVTSVVLRPWQALEYLDGVMERRDDVAVVGIAGPGDPLANAEATLETLRGVHARHPGLLLCLATNGVALPEMVEQLRALPLSHLTVTINAVEPAVAGRIYAWVRAGRRLLRGEEAGEFVVSRQLAALDALRDSGILVKVNTVVVPGVNDHCVVDVAAEAARRGAHLFNCIPLVPAAGSCFGGVTPPSPERMSAIQAAAAAHLPLMEHCTRCRADACGLLNEGTATGALFALRAAASLSRPRRRARSRVAVATREGVMIGGHLGEAETLSVFDRVNGAIELVERRPTPPPGGGAARWQELAERFMDCHTVVVTGVGPGPRAKLEECGIEVVEAEGLMEEALPALLAREPLPSHMRRRFAGCGSACAGTGQGCG